MKALFRVLFLCPRKNVLSVFLVLTLGIQGCSFFKTKKESTTDQPSTSFQATVSPMSNPVPVPIDVVKAVSDESHETDEATAPTVISSNATSEEKSISGTNEVSDPKKPLFASKAKKKLAPKGHTSYQVRHGDTLMKIAFEKYGDIYRWREIYENNKDLVKNYNRLAAGTVLEIKGVEFVVIVKNGQPYLIRRNDTLAKISGQIFGTSEKWRNLWANNKQLIKNPNKIYAGFTLYYQKDESIQKREPAEALKK